MYCKQAIFVLESAYNIYGILYENNITTSLKFRKDTIHFLFHRETKSGISVHFHRTFPPIQAAQSNFTL